MAIVLIVSISFTESVTFTLLKFLRLILILISTYENFNDQFKRRSKECKEAIQAINNRQALRKVADLLAYELVYWHVIPHNAEELDKIRLSPLRIEGWAPQRDDFNSESSRAKLNANLPLTRVQG